MEITDRFAVVVVTGALGRGLSCSCTLSITVLASGTQVVELFQVCTYVCSLWLTQEVSVHLSTVAEHHRCWPASHAHALPLSDYKNPDFAHLGSRF